MNIHECQAKEILAKFGAPCLRAGWPTALNKLLAALANWEEVAGS